MSQEAAVKPRRAGGRRAGPGAGRLRAVALCPAQPERPRDAEQEEVQRVAPTGPDQEDSVDG